MDARLLCLDAGRPDHLGPFLRLVDDAFAKGGGRTGDRRAAEVGKPRLEFWVGERRIDLPIEPVCL